ncbi:MFS transporter (plasmid) [Streptomyces sp. NBC_01591]|uniref:MFS transporter n=1 Tax=Streptomyces sp. NBC_01591 TaxID=2975888 RepID=UPI002DDA17EC|nr:MFS transporter [Streptomyces sp. NBC_01591]WSD73889.1 MFS transporter [Streptomyces sp. NBC_01591]
MVREQGSATSPTRLRAARAGLTGVFFVNGALFGTWASRVPTIKEQVDADTGVLGLTLLGIAFGALLAKQLAGQLVTRAGTVPVTRAGAALACLTLLPPAFVHGPARLGVALVLFGAAMGLMDVGMNAHGVELERLRRRPVMSSLHASFSAGGLAGALFGGVMAAHGVNPRTHFALVAVALGVLAAVASVRLLPTRPPRQRDASRAWVPVPRRLRLPLTLLAVTGLCAAAGEGAAADWSALYLHEDLGRSAGFASLGYALFSVAMAAGRLAGDRLTARWGGLRTVVCAAAPTGTLFGLSLASSDPLLALCGFTALGLGLSVVVPVVFSMAGGLGGERFGPALTYVSSINGTGMLMGPPLIGFAAEAVGLRAALGLVSLLAVLSAVLMCTFAAHQRRNSSQHVSEYTPKSTSATA